MRRIVVLAVAAALAGAAAGAANADGDPASDVFLSDNVFISYQSPYGSAEGRALEALTKDAKRQGLPIKVAVITQIADLGSVGGLYGKAQRYADFLGSEDAFAYRGTTVVVMNGKPGGFGVHGPGATPAAKRALATMKLPKTRTAAELASVAATAVQRVAAASGHRLAVPAGTAKKNTSTKLLDVFLIAALGLAALGGGAALLARWLRGGSSAPA